jgi:hypothetical protein
MSPKKDRGPKTETLSLRLDPKTKFILEFVARIKGQTLTTVVERAIQSSCSVVEIGAPDDFAEPRKWSDLWDPDEGVRTLLMLEDGAYPTTYDEDALHQFVKQHREFFFDEEKKSQPRREFVEILWPKIEDYRRIWEEQRKSDYWAAGKSMAADLVAAKVEPPMWPRPAKKILPKTQSAKKTDLDDEISF